MDVPRTADSVKRASVKTSVNSHMDTDCVYAWDMAKLERENAANIEQLNTLAALFGHDNTIGGESVVEYMARMVGKLRNENAALADALRVRIEQAAVEGSDDPCGLCGRYIGHYVTCRHFETERKVMGDGTGYAPGDCWATKALGKRDGESCELFAGYEDTRIFEIRACGGDVYHVIGHIDGGGSIVDTFDNDIGYAFDDVDRWMLFVPNNNMSGAR